VPKIGGALSLWGRVSWVPILHNVAKAEAYLLAKFHLDPSNRLATVHQRHREYRQTDRQSDSIGRTVLHTVAQKCSSNTWPHLENKGRLELMAKLAMVGLAIVIVQH